MKRLLIILVAGLIACQPKPYCEVVPEYPKVDIRDEHYVEHTYACGSNDAKLDEEGMTACWEILTDLTVPFSLRQRWLERGYEWFCTNG